MRTQTTTEKLLALLHVSIESMVSKGQLINISMYLKTQNDNLIKTASDLTFELFCENPKHPRFAEFEESDLNKLRTLKFGGKLDR